MKLQEITIDHEKLFFPVLGDGGQGKRKKKGKNYYQIIVLEGPRVKRSWRTLKQSRAFTRVRGNAESDRIGSRRFPVLPLVFFSALRTTRPAN